MRERKKFERQITASFTKYLTMPNKKEKPEKKFEGQFFHINNEFVIIGAKPT